VRAVINGYSEGGAKSPQAKNGGNKKRSTERKKRGKKRIKKRFNGKTTTIFPDNSRVSYYINPQKFKEYLCTA
jgi:hypothetical protein